MSVTDCDLLLGDSWEWLEGEEPEMEGEGKERE